MGGLLDSNVLREWDCWTDFFVFSVCVGRVLDRFFCVSGVAGQKFVVLVVGVEGLLDRKLL